MRRRYKSYLQGGVRHAATVISRTLPLAVRKMIVRSRACRKTKAGAWFAIGMLDDLRRRDPDALHRFLWSNHLAYAATYEVSRRFGPSNLNPSRRILFDEMHSHLLSHGFDPGKKVRSILEIGCSMGYLLRHLEVEVFPSAETLHGIDIDEYAVTTGMAHLSSLQSKVKLSVADMAAADRVIGDRTYDLVLCCGVLMYVNERTADEVVRLMCSRANCLVGIICLAHPEDHRTAPVRSAKRSSDGAFIHDVDQMIRRAAGTIVRSTFIGTEISGSSPSYAILAVPPSSAPLRVSPVKDRYRLD
jgi:2-polyprenyl-3-methyl-5-hydroxy-6-metoxy-1,4-benzoquinol methylase